MTIHTNLISLAAGAAALSLANAASAQSTTQDRIGQVLGALVNQATSLDAQWARGQRPLSTGQAQFQTRLDTDIRSGSLTSSGAARLRTDYEALVALEARYAADGRFTTQERTDLTDKYGSLTQSLAEGGPREELASGPSVADGRAEFETRINAAVNARRLTRTQATTLRNDYAALIQTETTYARDGISARERAELDARQDALDAPIGYAPSGATATQTPRQRLTELETAVGAAERNGTVSRAEAADIRVEHGDLLRLEAAYSTGRPSADDSAYLTRRLGELEARVNARR